MLQFDKKKYVVGKANHYSSHHKKTQIILADSLRKENFHIKRLQKKDFGKSKIWPTFTITREGEIYQHFNPKAYSDFFGNKAIDKRAITVVLENMGMLFYDYGSDSYLNWIHEQCDENMVYEREWKGLRYWEEYTENQFLATVSLCKYLCGEHMVSMDCLGYNVLDKEVETFKGIVTRSNYNSDYNDLNPSFDFGRFLNELGIKY